MAAEVLTPDQVERYRTLRLEALATDPDAFGSTLEREQGFDDATWAARIGSFGGRPGVVIVATDDHGTDIGVCGAGFEGDEPTTTLWGMWVRPADRGSGAATVLLDRAIRWSVERGATSMVLWVVRTNDRAIALYRNAGFEPTGDVTPLPSNPCAEELAMRRPL